MDVLTRPQTVPMRPRRPRRRWWLLVWPALIIALLYWWWQSQPRSYHQVARSTTASITLIPCRQGYLTIETGDAYVLRDWVTGKEKWRVPRPAPGHIAFAYGVTWSIGEQGDVFATAVDSSFGMQVTFWRDGRRISTQPVFMKYPKARFGLQVLNDGRVMAWSCAPGAPALLLRNGTVVTSGLLLPKARRVQKVSVAPDGSLAIIQSDTGSTAAALSIRGSRIVATPTRLTDSAPASSLYPPYGDAPAMLVKEHFFSDDMTLRTRHGLVPGHAGWSTDTITPGGAWLYQSKGTRSRAIAPATGDQWSFTVPGDLFGGDVTMDGRWALTHFGLGEKAPVSRVTKLLREIPGFNKVPDPSDRNFLGLYERPGKLRAILPLDIDKWAPDITEENSWWFPSPDGHGYVISIFDMMRDKGTCVLFRW